MTSKHSSVKPYNNNTWTQARFNSFIKSALRSATRRWGPIHSTLKKARVERGLYRCNGFHCSPHIVPISIKEAGKKRGRNIFVDHINPIISLKLGFTSWDDVIERMFVEEKDLQVLCRDCHLAKTKQEKEQRKKNNDPTK